MEVENTFLFVCQAPGKSKKGKILIFTFSLKQVAQKFEVYCYFEVAFRFQLAFSRMLSKPSNFRAGRHSALLAWLMAPTPRFCAGTQ
jgi:hypothetical protein